MKDNRTKEPLYANAKDTCSANALPPLGRSDHNLFFLTPKYVLLVQQQLLVLVNTPPCQPRLFAASQTTSPHQKKKAFQSKDKQEMRRIKCDLKAELRRAKDSYRRRMGPNSSKTTQEMCGLL